MLSDKKIPRLRRHLKRQKNKAVKSAGSADSGIDQHLANRVYRFDSVKRFIFGWTTIVLLIIGLAIYQFSGFYASTRQSVPGEGGVFREGILGKFTNANPVFATGSVDSSVSKLLYSGLLKYDGDGKLVGDLAESWTVDAAGSVYTVKLKNNLKWHDSQPITSADVEYTYALIQSPDLKSPLRSSWQGVKVKAVDDRTISFVLQGSISSFPQYLVNGIVPKHVYEKIDIQQIRSSNRNNQDVVGSGPFELSKVEVEKLKDGQTSERLSLSANKNYHLGRPKIDQYFVQTYKEEESMIKDFGSNRLDAINGVTNPEKVAETNKNVLDESKTLTSQVNVFFKVGEPAFVDPNMRRALVLAINRSEAVKELNYPVKVSDSPFLDSTFAYNKAFVQKTNNIPEAKKLLDSAGWIVNPATGTREKAGQKLEFNLTVRSLQKHKEVAQSLANQWKGVGVNAKLLVMEEDEMQSAIASHNYSAILSAINLGYDPDIFAFWHSSQKDIGASSRLNLSEYSSKPADSALQGGRSRIEPEIRAVKYAPFLTNWIADNPALTIYQPRYVFLVKEPLYNFNTNTMSTNTDRYNNVHNWSVKDKKVRKNKYC